MYQDIDIELLLTERRAGTSARLDEGACYHISVRDNWDETGKIQGGRQRASIKLQEQRTATLKRLKKFGVFNLPI